MKMRRRYVSGTGFFVRALCALVASCLLTLRVQAHRLDELLQATLIEIGPEMIELEINLTPGVEVASEIIAEIDTNRDGAISEKEARTFVQSLLHAVELTLDDRKLDIKYLSQEIVPLDDLRAGVGVMHVKARAALGSVASGEHRIVYRNHPLAAVSVYLVNALVPATSRITIHSQERDELQTTLKLAYTLHAAEPVVFRPASAPGPADNPLKGFVPYAGQGREFPHSLEFDYLPLAAMMTGPTNFNWTPLERLLDGIASRGCQSVFRIYMEYPRKPSGVPQFLITAGVNVRAWTNTNTQPFPPALDHTPDYEDPRLRAALTNFIAALGARYDGDPRIGFITAGLLGTWGEWHCHPHSEWFASRKVQAEVMDAYEAAFRKTPVLLRYPAGENDFAHAPNGRRNLGYHDDSFAWATLETGRMQDDWFYIAALRKAGPAAMDRWRTSPIGGEIRPELWPCLWKTAGCKEGQDFARCVRETHASWLMDTSTSKPLATDERERAIAAARSLGYELQIVQATAKLTDRRLEVSVTITNRGVAPFYANWPVRVMALGSAGDESVTELPVALNTLLPETAATCTGVLDLAKVVSGEIKWFVGILNPLQGGRPLRFANADDAPFRNGWLTLGKIVVP